MVPIREPGEHWGVVARHCVGAVGSRCVGILRRGVRWEVEELEVQV